MKITIVILNYNGKKDTISCLQTINQLQAANHQLETVVVDNNSSDGSVPSIKAKFPRVKLILNKKNLGFSEGNNIGIRYALKNGTDYIMFLNNDTLVDKSVLAQLMKLARKDQQIGIISPKIYFAPGHEFHKKRYSQKQQGKVIWYAGGQIDWKNVLASHRGVDEFDTGQYNQIQETDFATGCCMLVKKQVFTQVGFFDKKYFLYWEDIDLCQRAKRAGFKIIYNPNAFLWHKNASSSGGAGRKTSIYYQTRNRLLFSFNYTGLRAKLAVLKESLNYLIKGNQWQKKAIKDFFLFRFGKIIL